MRLKHTVRCFLEDIEEKQLERASFMVLFQEMQDFQRRNGDAELELYMKRVFQEKGILSKSFVVGE